jgi:CheY-like chemotaxis protein/anti-sigma regulatory factor (Ser/Thr protein kinase)/anti-anti-sigma regulatory factor
MPNSILVAEDSRTQGAKIKLMLEQAGYEVDLAANGRLALERIRQASPDLVLTDLMMPEMDGLELVEAVKTEFPALPIVLMTALGSEEIAAAALRKGAASYVPKRNLDNDIVETVGRVLEMAQAGRATQRLADRTTVLEMQMLLENDQSLIPGVISRLRENLRQMEFCDENGLLQIGMALDEALVNAITHGNLECSSRLRDVDGGKPFVELVNRRRHESPYCSRRVFISAKTTRFRTTFVIRDEGPGFDPSSVPDPTDPANLERTHGRGLQLIHFFMDHVSHNRRGNELTMVKDRKAMERSAADQDLVKRLPRVFNGEISGPVLVVSQLQRVTALTEANVQDELQVLLSQIEDHQLKGLVVDFCENPEFGSGMVEVIMRLWRKMGSQPDSVALCNPSEIGREVFRVTRLDSLWGIHSSREEAIRAVRVAVS